MLLGAPRLERPIVYLAAATVVVAATAVIVGRRAVIAAAAEQDQQDDDPAPVTATETIVIHNCYLQEFIRGIAAHSKIFRGIKYVRHISVYFFQEND